MMYLDDVLVGGSLKDVIHDLDVIKAAENLGLVLNNSKFEIICHGDAAGGTIITALLGAMVVDPERACLLGSPL